MQLWWMPTNVAAMAPPSSMGNDPFTTVLLHCEGANGSTTITDSNVGGSAKTWTVAGNAQISTAASKFGSASLLCDGTGDWITTPDHADWTFGSGDLTIDFWFKVAAGNGTERGLMGDSSAGFTFNWIIYLNTSNALVFSGLGGAVGINGGTITDASGWKHCALVREGSTFSLYLDGTRLNTGTSSSAMTDATRDIYIGRMGNWSNPWNGYIDEVRVSKGIARWSGASFTPPTEAYA